MTPFQRSLIISLTPSEDMQTLNINTPDETITITCIGTQEWNILLYFLRREIHEEFCEQDFIALYSDAGLSSDRGKLILDLLIAKGVFFQRMDIHGQLRHISRFFENPSLLIRTDEDTRYAYDQLFDSEHHKKTQNLTSVASNDTFARTSIRQFSGENISMSDLSDLLLRCYATKIDGHRPVPSGGAFYPLHFFYLANDDTHSLHRWNVDGFVVERHSDAGIVHYTVPDDDMDWDGASGLLFVMAGLEYSSKKYGYKALRLAYLEAGHCAQNIYLSSNIHAHIGVCEIAGVYEDRIYAELGLDRFIFMTAFVIGHK